MAVLVVWLDVLYYLPQQRTRRDRHQDTTARPIENGDRSSLVFCPLLGGGGYRVRLAFFGGVTVHSVVMGFARTDDGHKQGSRLSASRLIRPRGESRARTAWTIPVKPQTNGVL